MKSRVLMAAALVAGMMVFASANSASAFTLLGGGCGCEVGPSCCEPAPCCKPKRCWKLFNRCCKPKCCEVTSCCDAAPACGCEAPAAPACGCDVAPACGCEADCCHRVKRHCCWKHRVRSWFNRGCCGGCDVGCGCEVAAPTCGCGG